MDTLPENIRLVHDYWHELGAGEAPERALVDIAKLKPVLGYLLLIEFKDDPFRVRYRLTGTIVDRMTGMNITGRYLDEFATGRFAEPIQYIASSYRYVYDTGKHFIGHYDWPVDVGVVKRSQMGLFPLRLNGSIRQCLSIEHYGQFETERKPIDWRPALPAHATEKTGKSVGERIGDKNRVVPLRAGR